MSTALATATPRLRKLVLMLSSDHDGAVLGAARAIGRVLKDAGADWHCFADAFSFGRQNQDRRSADWRAAAAADWRTMAQACREQSHRLSNAQFNFVYNIMGSQRDPTRRRAR